MKFQSFFKNFVSVIAVVSIFVSANAFADDQTDITEGATLVKGSDCFQCHRIPTKLIGPAYKDVAAKYKGADDVKVTELAQKVIKGGGGNWGTTPMRAHPMLVEADAKKMVKWVLSLGDAAATATPTATPTTAPATTTN